MFIVHSPYCSLTLFNCCSTPQRLYRQCPTSSGVIIRRRAAQATYHTEMAARKFSVLRDHQTRLWLSAAPLSAPAQLKAPPAGRDCFLFCHKPNPIAAVNPPSSDLTPNARRGDPCTPHAQPPVWSQRERRGYCVASMSTCTRAVPFSCLPCAQAARWRRRAVLSRWAAQGRRAARVRPPVRRRKMRSHQQSLRNAGTLAHDNTPNSVREQTAAASKGHAFRTLLVAPRRRI